MTWKCSKAISWNINKAISWNISMISPQTIFRHNWKDSKPSRRAMKQMKWLLRSRLQQRMRGLSALLRIPARASQAAILPAAGHQTPQKCQRRFPDPIHRFWLGLPQRMPETAQVLEMPHQQQRPQPRRHSSPAVRRSETQQHRQQRQDWLHCKRAAWICVRLGRRKLGLLRHGYGRILAAPPQQTRRRRRTKSRGMTKHAFPRHKRLQTKIRACQVRNRGCHLSRLKDLRLQQREAIPEKSKPVVVLWPLQRPWLQLQSLLVPIVPRQRIQHRLEKKQ
mmetsp:Transcript_85617/g.169922  ORF Transcript_85617/g.169922 Transcript_85617/m.169922 type:complete len:279 (-) Transcript_85617:322-1158(-)